MSVASFIFQENGCCNEGFTGTLCDVINFHNHYIMTIAYCRKGAQQLEYFMVNMASLPFGIYFVGLSVTEEQ